MPAKKYCRSRKMLQNEYLVAKIGSDTAENELRKEWFVVARSPKEWCVVARGGAAGAPWPCDLEPRFRSVDSQGRSSHDTSLFPRPVLGCINTDFCNQILILQHLSRSTKWASWIFKICKIFRKNPKFNAGNFTKIREFNPDSPEFAKIPITFANFLKIQLAHFVDLEKCCKMSIWL